MLIKSKDMSNYPYKKLSLLEPAFGTSVTSLIIDLNILREKRLYGSTPPLIFFQLKSLFHILESLGSARIEGNHTTLLEFIESKIEKKRPKDEGVKEIENGEKTLEFIDKTIKHNKNFSINESFIKELQRRVVEGLSPELEGDANAGEYRDENHTIIIKGAEHKPPKALELKYYMDELIDFINEEDEPKYDLLKIALAHHRFVWIHPFGNGNGRTVRLLTYAQLVRAGFRVDVGGRIINPTAVFCSDRVEYYKWLSGADTGTQEGLTDWCEYVLKGLKDEIEKIDKLIDYSYLSKEILLPAIDISLERKVVTDLEAEILRIAIKKEKFEMPDIKHLFPKKLPSHISRFLAKMKDKKLIIPETENGRKYLINFGENYLIRAVIEMLGKNGFLPPEK